MQTDRHTYIHTHTHTSCNAVTLVWGSLRLAPITRNPPPPNQGRNTGLQSNLVRKQH